MTGFESQLRRIAALLRRFDQRFALVGGLAVSTRAEPRLTRDADLAVAVAGDAEAELLVHRLQAEGYSILAAVEQEATGRLATIRLSDHSSKGAVTDLLFASSGIEPEIAQAADDLAILPGLVLPVASVGHLIAMKLLARDDRRRPMDADDLRALHLIASDEDWSQAAKAIALIESRGYARGRNLSESLDTLRIGGPY